MTTANHPQDKDLYAYARSYSGEFVAVAGPFATHVEAETGYAEAMQRLRTERGSAYVSGVEGASYAAQEPGSPPPRMVLTLPRDPFGELKTGKAK